MNKSYITEHAKTLCNSCRYDLLVLGTSNFRLLSIWCLGEGWFRWPFRRYKQHCKVHLLILFLLIKPLYGFSLPWWLQLRWSLRTFIFPFSASARTSYSSTYHSSDTVAWNRDEKWVTKCSNVNNQGDVATKYSEKGYVQQEAYLEATDLLINLSNQPMEELDVIKRWCTLLHEDTTNIIPIRWTKQLRGIWTVTSRDLVLMAELVYRNVMCSMKITSILLAL